MVTFTVKGLPEEVHRKLKERARRHRRSLNSEVIASLEQSVLSSAIDTERFLQTTYRLRREVIGRLTDEQLQDLKSSGRP
jgi:plasmid stability protein